MAVPVGYLITAALAAGCVLLALVPLRRPPILAATTFRLSLVISELPFIAFYYLAASTVLAIGQHDVTSPGGWPALGLGVLVMAGLGVIAWRACRQAPRCTPRSPRPSATAGRRPARQQRRGFGACRWAASCSSRSSPVASAWRRWPTSATATRASATGSTCTATAAGR